MALITSMNNAISGLRAQQFRLDIIGDNLANSTTTGFKSSRAEFETLLSQTHSFGTAPSSSLGGIDPVQTGLGVRPGGVLRDFSQGQLEATGLAGDLAIEGDGFFVMNNQEGSPVYTRDGSFSINPSNYLHNPSNGFIVQGYQASFETFTVIPTDNAVTDIEIPIGELTIAEQTTEAQFIGNLNGSGQTADSGTVLESEQFLDSGGVPATLNTSLFGLQRTGPSGPIDLGLQNGSIIEIDVEKGNRSMSTKTFAVSSTPVPGTDAFGDTMADLVEFMEDSMGINDSSDYSYSAIASRQTSAGTLYATGTVQELAGELIDENSYTALPSIDFRALGAEEGDFIRFTTGPAAGQTAQIEMIGSANGGSNNVLEYTTLDTDISLPGEGMQWEINQRSNVGLGASSTVSTAMQATDTLTTASFQSTGTDFVADGVVVGDTITFDTGSQVLQAVVDSIGGVGNDTLNFTAASNLTAAQVASVSLGDAIEIDGTAFYSEILGTDSFGASLDTFTRAGKDFRAAGVAEGDYVRFETPSGTMVATVDSINAAGDTLTFTGPLAQQPALATNFRIDGRVDSHSEAGRIRIMGNVGEANGITGLSFRVQNGVQMSTFQELAEAEGESTVVTATVFDSRGDAHLVELTLSLVSKSDRGVRFQWFGEAEDDVNLDRVIGTGFVDFDTDGQFLRDNPQSAISIELNNTGVESPVIVDAMFDRVTAFANQLSQLNLAEQDGYEKGTLRDFSVGVDGTVTGIFSNGQTKTLAQIAIARFQNPNGMNSIGGNMWEEAANSGEPIVGVAGQGARGLIRSGFLEESNVDFARQFTDMIVSQRAFQANARTISTADELLEELVNIV